MKGHIAENDNNNVAAVKVAKPQIIQIIDFATDPRYANPDKPQEQKGGEVSTRVLSREMAESLEDD